MRDNAFFIIGFGLVVTILVSMMYFNYLDNANKRAMCYQIAKDEIIFESSTSISINPPTTTLVKNNEYRDKYWEKFCGK